ncbi:MAG: hypothetical protein J0I40_08440 [Cellulomonas sp.]|uniref:hypothetical protein n=1 Tax=Cellulomonas sp. 73-92 TaxID=1895740 RepID=UPI0009277176|nr:hypothetical protein [Cellulomonas sp. 73-92]MBN9375400.1 hypothetical protein [Cellulomonas sp.]OJV76488.1 MAG: hypothetical protein BGO37_10545 [Cellulomonas sp. 73-92]
MIAPFGLQALPHPREGIYRRADLARTHAEEQHRQALADRDTAIDRCPGCGGWRAHPQPGEGGRNRLPQRLRPARHICPEAR